MYEDSPELKAAFDVAEELANEYAHAPITTVHLALGLLHDQSSKIAQIMSMKYGVTYDRARHTLALMKNVRLLSGMPSFQTRLSPGAKSAISLMNDRLGEAHAGSEIQPTEQLFTALFIQADDDFANMLDQLHLDRDAVLAKIDPTAVPVD